MAIEFIIGIMYRDIIEESACVLLAQVVIEAYTGEKPYVANREPKRLVRYAYTVAKLNTLDIESDHFLIMIIYMTLYVYTAG